MTRSRVLLAKEVPRARLARQLPRPIAGSGALPLLPRPSLVRPHAPPALLHRLSQARARGPFRCQRQRTPLLAPGTNPSQSQGQGSARPAARSREGGSSPRVGTAARTPQALVSRGHGLNMVSKQEQRTRPSLPPPRPPLGTPPRCPPRAGGRQGGGALGRAVPAARCPLASGLRGLSVSPAPHALSAFRNRRCRTNQARAVRAAFSPSGRWGLKSATPGN